LSAIVSFSKLVISQNLNRTCNLEYTPYGVMYHICASTRQYQSAQCTLNLKCLYSSIPTWWSPKIFKCLNLNDVDLGVVCHPEATTYI